MKKGEKSSSFVKSIPTPGNIRYINQRTGREYVEGQDTTGKVIMKNDFNERFPLDVETGKQPHAIGQTFPISAVAVSEINFGAIVRGILAVFVLAVCVVVIFLVIASVQAARRANTT